MVEEVVELKPDLKHQAFVYVSVLVDSHVCLYEVRISERIISHVAIGTLGGHGKLAGGEHSGRIGIGGSSLLITGHVGEAEVVSVGQIVTAQLVVRCVEGGRGED